jgi:hypothetical protein
MRELLISELQDGTRMRRPVKREEEEEWGKKKG